MPSYYERAIFCTPPKHMDWDETFVKRKVAVSPVNRNALKKGINSPPFHHRPVLFFNTSKLLLLQLLEEKEAIRKLIFVDGS